MPDDPFPRERVTATLRRLPAYVKLAWRLARDPLLGRARRAAVMAAAGYLASPIDLVPDVFPVLGRLDDIAVAIAALRFALAGLDPERRRAHLVAVGLEDDDLNQDLRTVAAASAWLVRAGARTTGRVARRGGRLAATGARAAAHGTRAAVSAVGSAAGSAASAASSAASAAGPTARGAAAGARPAIGVVTRRLPRRRPSVADAPDALNVEPDPGPG
jgi:uncharacterized membrane protein YkvA (DUF1232 family)